MVQISNLTTFESIKEKYIQEAQLDGIAAAQIRFFAMGKELDNKLAPYNYNIDDDMTVQCIVRAN